jgi:hypothetical protein
MLKLWLKLSILSVLAKIGFTIVMAVLGTTSSADKERMANQSELKAVLVAQIDQHGDKALISIRKQTALCVQPGLNADVQAYYVAGLNDIQETRILAQKKGSIQALSHAITYKQQKLSEMRAHAKTLSGRQRRGLIRALSTMETTYSASLGCIVSNLSTDLGNSI